MAGLSVQVTAAQVNQALGTIARDVNSAIERVQPAQRFLQQNTDQELIADYGMEQGDLDLLRAAFTDLNKLRRIYEGDDPLPAAQNFRVNVRRIIGLGFL
jgi:Cu/Ag efflux pump CusA